MTLQDDEYLHPLIALFYEVGVYILYSINVIKHLNHILNSLYYFGFTPNVVKLGGQLKNKIDKGVCQGKNKQYFKVPYFSFVTVLPV